MYVGLAAGLWPNFQSDEAKVGKLGIHRSYNPGDLPADYANSACNNDWGDKLYSAFSWAPNSLSAITSGSYDSRIVAWWKSIPAGAHVYWAFVHEADAKVAKGVWTVADLNASYQHVAALLARQRSLGVPQAINQVTFIVCLTAYYWNPSNPVAPGQLDPMCAAADMTIVDAYGKGQYGAVNACSHYDAFCAAHGYRQGIWEFSTQSTQPGGKPQWITDMIAHCYATGYEMACGFDSTVGGSEALLSDAASVAAFSKANAQYGTLPGGVAPPPPPPPPPPPGGGGGGVLASAGNAGTYLTSTWE